MPFKGMPFKGILSKEQAKEHFVSEAPFQRSFKSLRCRSVSFSSLGAGLKRLKFSLYLARKGSPPNGPCPWSPHPILGPDRHGQFGFG